MGKRKRVVVAYDRRTGEFRVGVGEKFEPKWWEGSMRLLETETGHRYTVADDLMPSRVETTLDRMWVDKRASVKDVKRYIKRIAKRYKKSW